MSRYSAISRRRALVPFPKELGRKAWLERLASFGIAMPRAALTQPKRTRRGSAKHGPTVRWLQWVEAPGDPSAERVLGAAVIRWIAFPHRISLDWIVIAPDERDQGIGASFLSEAERYACSVVQKIETFRDVTDVQLSAVVRESDLPVQKLLRHVGMRYVRTEFDPLGDEDFYVFEKRIGRDED